MTIYNMLETVRNRMAMRDAREALEGIGVSIYKEKGTTKASVSVLEDLSNKWESLTDKQKQDISIAIAGRYHVSRFVSMMNNWK